ncbi:hypothetical protein H9P43_006394 [Blastocladiella emersonii ATCC 22665]|nr:hypothetical protein H9P43_006394 [Blastocladiella emersonii ATCC 22665]
MYRHLATTLSRRAPTAAATPSRSIQYLVRIPDFTDADALTRRMGARPAHLASAAALQEQGILLAGGAQLGGPDCNTMVGSVFILDMPDERALRDLLRADPYVTAKVWDVDRAEVQKIKLARLGTLKA